jgi:hypothetical protein
LIVPEELTGMVDGDVHEPKQRFAHKRITFRSLPEAPAEAAAQHPMSPDASLADHSLCTWPITLSITRPTSFRPKPRFPALAGPRFKVRIPAGKHRFGGVGRQSNLNRSGGNRVIPAAKTDVAAGMARIAAGIDA